MQVLEIILYPSTSKRDISKDAIFKELGPLFNDIVDIVKTLPLWGGKTWVRLGAPQCPEQQWELILALRVTPTVPEKTLRTLAIKPNAYFYCSGK